jgi:hypothetical protein
VNHSDNQSNETPGRNIMNAHDRNLVFMTFLTAALVSLNFFAVITGMADVYYDWLTELLKPVLIAR